MLCWKFFFSFSILKECHSILAYKISAVKSADSLMRILLYVASWLSLIAFKILSLSLTFDILRKCVLVWISLGSSYLELSSLLVSAVFFLNLGNFSAIVSSNNFSAPFSLLLLGAL